MKMGWFRLVHFRICRKVHRLTSSNEEIMLANRWEAKLISIGTSWFDWCAKMNGSRYLWIGFFEANIHVECTIAAVARRIQALSYHMNEREVNFFVLVKWFVQANKIDFAIWQNESLLLQQTIHVAFKLVVFKNVVPITESLNDICNIHTKLNVSVQRRCVCHGRAQAWKQMELSYRHLFHTLHILFPLLPSEIPILATQVSCMGFHLAKSWGGGYL